MIIDSHTHLGDILYPDGGALIEKTGVAKRNIFDPVSISEATLHRGFGVGKQLYRLLGRWVTIAERERNFTATRENMRQSMNEAGVAYNVCLPVPPYVYFNDLLTASKKDHGIIPFTGFDYSQGPGMLDKVKLDVEQGAKGLKLHSIIQNKPLNSRETMEGVDFFGQFGLPVLFHAGISSYYLQKERINENPKNGGIHFGEILVKSFPKVHFIVGHAGLYEVGQVINLLSRYKNVWVDISFQSPEKIIKLIKAFGPERILFGSDWPYGNRLTAIKSVKEACRGDQGLEQRIYYQNASELWGIS